MSGRRRASSAGSPIDTSVGTAAPARRLFELGAQRLGLASQQLAELVDVLRDLRIRTPAARRGSRWPARAALLTSMCGGQARRTPLARQIQQLVDGGEILVGDAQARLRAAQLDIACATSASTDTSTAR